MSWKSPAMLLLFLFVYRPFSIFSTSYVCSLNLGSVSCIQQTVYLCIACPWQWNQCAATVWKLYEWWMWALIWAGWYLRLRLSAWIITGSKIRANKHTLYMHTHTYSEKPAVASHLDKDLCFPLNFPQPNEKNDVEFAFTESVYLFIHWCWLPHKHTRLHIWKYILPCVRPLLIHAELTFNAPEKWQCWKALCSVKCEDKSHVLQRNEICCLVITNSIYY